MRRQGEGFRVRWRGWQPLVSLWCDDEAEMWWWQDWSESASVAVDVEEEEEERRESR